ncbi:comE operon protein 2 [Calderihabitans maritimus]|uniref:ComE operon protein 2 n=1 Tax=Calderihabitans maritimus TaxID=1246530 RepID=A0A1Z5HWB6_9FIRM|nr:cytidine/deoxycytidylate deaminase family protein [Calderihabitans maritimus]GAW93826.1 comE operon protein 2 [Calderihabitans maritimus]
MNNNRRLSWDEYFMEITEVVAKRSTCLRRQVGAIITRDNRILSTGYNGAPSGLAHCDEVGCLREAKGVPAGEKHELCRGVHAEQNAVIQAATYGASIKGGTLFTTYHPCVLCTKILINAGIKRVVYRGDYPDNLAVKLMQEAGIEVVRFSGLREKGETECEKENCSPSAPE